MYFKWVLLLFLFFIFESNFLFSNYYNYPYLINGSSPSYFLANQSFDDSFSIFENDAFFSSFKKIQLGAFYTSSFGTLSTHSMVFDYRLSQNFFISIGTSSIHDSKIEKTVIDTTQFDLPFIHISDYTYKNIHSKLSLKYKQSTHLKFGSGFNYYKTFIDDKIVSGYDLSLGLIKHFSKFDFAFSILNILNSKLKYANKYESLSSLFITNFRYNLNSWFNFSIRLSYMNQSVQLLRPFFLGIGTHFNIHKYLNLSFGMIELINPLKVIRCPSIGMNLTLLGLNIKYLYKYTNFIYSLNSHFISISFKK